MKFFVPVLAAVIALAFLNAPTTHAAPGTGACVQAGHDLIVAVLDSPFDTEGGTMGDAISDGFFGNEPNLTDTNTNLDLGPNEVEPGSSAGSVVGSASPGPKLNGGGFLTWGSVIRGSVPGTCN